MRSLIQALAPFLCLALLTSSHASGKRPLLTGEDSPCAQETSSCCDDCGATTTDPAPSEAPSPECPSCPSCSCCAGTVPAALSCVRFDFAIGVVRSESIPLLLAVDRLALLDILHVPRSALA